MYRAMQVYPNPVDLVMLFQQTLPEKLFTVLMGVMQLRVKARV